MLLLIGRILIYYNSFDSYFFVYCLLFGFLQILNAILTISFGNQVYLPKQIIVVYMTSVISEVSICVSTLGQTVLLLPTQILDKGRYRKENCHFHC